MSGNKFYINNTKNNYVEFFIDENPKPLVIIAPGGGYEYTSIRESDPVALAFNSFGYHSVIVNYREDINELYPIPGNNLAYVLNKYQNDKRVTKIIGLGFSAGGHNMLEVTVHNKKYNVAKPDLLILGYPVITSNEAYSHKNSFLNLLGSEGYKNKELLNYVSLENQITDNEPDLFLFGTITDKSVDAKNSILLLDSYHNHNLNIEYHLFPFGPHGLSLATEDIFKDNPEKINPYFASWIKDATKWLDYKINKTVRK